MSSNQKLGGGGEPGVVLGLSHPGRTESGPRQIRRTPSRSVGVELAAGALTGVESRARHARRTNLYRRVEDQVQTADEALGGDFRWKIYMRHLRGSVDPGVGTPGADNRGRVTNQLSEGPFQLALHGALGRLPLPAMEICAEIGHDEFYSVRHGGHPRTGHVETAIDISVRPR